MDRLQGHMLPGITRWPAWRLTQQRSVSVTGNLFGTDGFVAASAAAGNVFLTLPPANGNLGRRIIVQKSDATANTVTVQRGGGDLIGFAGSTSTVLTTQDMTVEFISNGVSRWLTTALGGGGGGGGGGGSVTAERDTVSGPSSTLTLAFTPVSESESVCVNGLVQRKVASAPSIGEYTLSGTTVTFGIPLFTGDRAWATYLIGTGITPQRDTFAGPASGVVLSTTPMTDSEAVMLNGIVLRKVVSAPSIGEYTLSGATVTFGIPLVAGDHAWVTYL